MKQRAARHTVKDLLEQVAELRQLVTELKMENARLRAELAALRGDDDPGGERGSDEAPAEVAPARKTPPRWVKANVVVTDCRKPRRARQPVPGASPGGPGSARRACAEPLPRVRERPGTRAIGGSASGDCVAAGAGRVPSGCR